MRIERHIGTPATELTRRHHAEAPLRADREATDFERSNQLEQALKATPDSRAERVARAKILVADPKYPSPEHLRSIARVLADHLTKPESAPAAEKRVERVV